MPNEALEKWYTEDLAEWCAKLEKCLGSGGWAVGSKFSLADLSIWYLFADGMDRPDVVKGVYSQYPGLKSVCDSVAVLPGVQQWTETRPSTPF